ncbi:HutD/Ves family protein [Pseudarthrobacter sp. J1738]|uniref:HutD/Ves family protein n=1 Tax=Pseudarthrobacter sp. J1738 TaxID=3420446 RepID=UPI003D2E1F2F
MEIIRFAALKATPWKNGGGITREVASQQAQSGEGIDWRISLAEVSKAGPFSEFPGMDRVLTVTDGELLLLEVDGESHPLEKYRAFRFAGDVPAAASLPTGEVRDLNVITRRGAFKGFTSIIELSKKRAHPVFAGQHAILLHGQADVSAAEETEKLERYDAVVGADENPPEILGRGFLAVVSIDPLD